MHGGIPWRRHKTRRILASGVFYGKTSPGGKETRVFFFFGTQILLFLKRKTHKNAQKKIHKISKNTEKNRRGQEMISSFMELFFKKKGVPTSRCFVSIFSRNFWCLCTRVFHSQKTIWGHKSGMKKKMDFDVPDVPCKRGNSAKGRSGRASESKKTLTISYHNQKYRDKKTSQRITLPLPRYSTRL